MTKIYYVTYATHSFSMFEELVNNEFNIKITVLGYGKKWNGFMDKINSVMEFSKTINDNDIIVFIDGFDSKVNKNTSGLLNEFYKYNCDILVSADPVNKNNIFLYYASKRVFGIADGDTIANSGLYMGYAKAINKLCKKILEKNILDDQEGFNKYFNKQSMKIDFNNKIFHNVRYNCNSVVSSAYFVSYPGAVKASFGEKIIRYKRAIGEYWRYFIPEIILLLVILICIIFLMS